MGGGLDWDPRHGSRRGSFLKRALGTAGGCHPRTPQPPFSLEEMPGENGPAGPPRSHCTIPHSVFGPLGSVSRYLTVERASGSGHQRCRPVLERRHSEEAGPSRESKLAGAALRPRDKAGAAEASRGCCLRKAVPNLSPSNDTTTLAEVTVPTARLEGH